MSYFIFLILLLILMRVIYPLSWFKKTSATLPTELTIGGRSYDIIGFLKGDEKTIRGNVIVTRAIEMSAHLGEEDCRHFLKYQSEIPTTLRDKVIFVFTNWRHPSNSENVAYVYWRGDSWVQSWIWLDNKWNGFYGLLRRK